MHYSALEFEHECECVSVCEWNEKMWECVYLHLSMSVVLFSLCCSSRTNWTYLVDHKWSASRLWETLQYVFTCVCLCVSVCVCVCVCMCMCVCVVVNKWLYTTLACFLGISIRIIRIHLCCLCFKRLRRTWMRLRCKKGCFNFINS